MYELSIHGMGAEKFNLEFGTDEIKFKNTTIKEIKEKLIREQALPLETDDIRLIFAGKQLNDDETVSSCDINNRSTIMSVTRVRGGLNK
jgi:hypothetical protein